MKHGKKVQRLAAVLMLVSFIFATAAPALAAGIIAADRLTASATSNSGVKGASTVYFGNFWQDSAVSSGKSAIAWKVLQTNAADTKKGSTSTAGVTLLTEKAMFAHYYGVGTTYWSDGNAVRDTLNGVGMNAKKSQTDPTVPNSDGEYGTFAGDAFSDKEFGYVLTTTRPLDDRAGPTFGHTDDKLFILRYNEAKNKASGGTMGFINPDDRKAEATYFAQYNVAYGNTENDSGGKSWYQAEWWLATPGFDSTYIRTVSRDGGIGGDGDGGPTNTTDDVSVRPVLNLDKESVIFLSAATGGKGSVAVGTGFALADYTGAQGWKLTLKDTTIAKPTSVTVTQAYTGYKTVDELAAATSAGETMDLTAGVTHKYGGDVTVAYSGKDANANFISAAVATGEGTTASPYVYENYAKISDQEFEATGRVVNTTNLDPSKEYTMFIFAEQTNGNYQTDYASETQAFKINTTTTVNYGILAESYAGNGLTALLGNDNDAGKPFDLGFKPAVYDTGVTVETGMSGNITADATEDTTNKVLIAGAATTTLTGNVTVEEGATLTTAGNFDLQGTNAIDGTVTGGALTISAATAAGSTTTVNETGSIENDITIQTGGTVKTEGRIANATVKEGGTLELDADKYLATGGVENAAMSGGTLKFTGGTLVNAVTGTGTTEIAGDVTAEANIGTAITVDENKKLTASADNIGGDVTNNGTVILTAETLTKAVTNEGTVTAKNGSTINSVITNTGATTTGATTLETGASFGTDGKITGGNVTLGEGVHFNASNLGTIADLTSNEAIYDFDANINNGDPQVDQITVTDKAAGKLKINPVNVTGTSSYGEWAIGDVKRVDYVKDIASREKTADNNLTITSTNVTVTSDGCTYIFNQGHATPGDASTAELVGTMDIRKDNGYTLAEIVQDYKDTTKTPAFYAGNVNAYSLLKNYNEENNLGEMLHKNPDRTEPRELTIFGNGYAFNGTGKVSAVAHEGITTTEDDTLTLKNITEISGWAGNVLTNNGKLYLDGEPGEIGVKFVGTEDGYSDIVNNGELYINKTSTFDNGISGTGTTYVNIDTNFNDTDLEQGTVTVADGLTADGIATLSAANAVIYEGAEIDVTGSTTIADSGSITGLGIDKAVINTGALGSAGNMTAEGVTVNVTTGGGTIAGDLALNEAVLIGADKDTVTETAGSLSSAGNAEVKNITLNVTGDGGSITETLSLENVTMTGAGAGTTEETAGSLELAGTVTVKDITVTSGGDTAIANGSAITGNGRRTSVINAGSLTGEGSASFSKVTVNGETTLNFAGSLNVTDADVNIKKDAVIGEGATITGTGEEAARLTAGGEVRAGGNITLDNAELSGVTLTADKDFSMANASKAAGNIAVTGNMIFKGAGTNEINGKATPYGYLDFWLDGYSDKDVIVHCNGTFDLSHVKTSAADGAPYGIRLFQDTDPHRLPDRKQYIALIEGGVTGYKGSHNENLPDEMIALRSNKALTAYKYGVYEKDGTLYAACMDLMTLQRGKSLAEGRMAAMTALNEAGDLIADNVIRTLNVTDHEWQSFASVRGTHGHYETGSYVDTNGTSVAGGLARKLSENTIFGIFTEGGYSHYNSHNDVEGFGPVTAKGNVNYFGGGILLRTEADATDKGSLYGEASVRAGRQSQDYNSETILPGTSVRYDADSRYIAAHAGVGYKHKLKSGNTMDTYVKYLYSHQGGADVTLAATGETVNYDPVESHRVRAGFRYTKEAAKNLKAFGGLAYEYEFSNEAASSTEGLAIAAPDMKGGSGVAELGITYKKPGSPWEIDFSINGAAGKRESISATLTAWYEFGRKGAKKAVEKVINPAEPKETKKAQAQPKTIAEAQRAAQVEDGAERFEKMFGGRRPEIEKAENKTQETADAKRKGNCVNSGTLPAYLPEKKKSQPAKTEKQRAEKISRPEKPEKPQTLGYDAKTGEVGGLGVLESPLLITR